MFELAILKLTAFCNLNCSYCYMFNQADGTFRRVERYMPLGTALKTLERIEEHAWEYGKEVFHVTLHGGEPTLWPYENFVGFLDRVSHTREQGLRLSVSMQTNGLRLPERLLDLLAAHDVTLGVSIDGPREHNDRVRLTHGGSGSYDRVMRTVERIVSGEYSDLLQGFLCVADPRIPPGRLVSWADSLPVRRIDILWPLHFHYGNPPWPKGNLASYAQSPRYGKWFSDVFEVWWRKNDPTLFIRHFYDCLEAILGSNRHIESIINDTVPIFVVNTDGGIEYHDYFRSYTDGGTRSGFDVYHHRLSSLAEDPVFAYLLHLGDHRPSECSACPVGGLCGGGFLAGRVEPGRSVPRFRSVLCLDQYEFFSRLFEILRPYLAQVETLRWPLPQPTKLREFLPSRFFETALARSAQTDPGADRPPLHPAARAALRS